MNWIISSLAAPLAVATTLTFGAVEPAAAQGACMSNMEMQAALSRGEIAPVARVLQDAGVARDSQVLSVKVCQTEGGWAYYVGVLNAAGQARTLVLRASG